MSIRTSYLLSMKLFAAVFGIAAMTVLAAPGFSQNTGQAVSSAGTP